MDSTDVYITSVNNKLFLQVLTYLRWTELQYLKQWHGDITLFLQCCGLTATDGSQRWPTFKFRIIIVASTSRVSRVPTTVGLLCIWRCNTWLFQKFKMTPIYGESGTFWEISPLFQNWSSKTPLFLQIWGQFSCCTPISQTIGLLINSF